MLVGKDHEQPDYDFDCVYLPENPCFRFLCSLINSYLTPIEPINRFKTETREEYWVRNNANIDEFWEFRRLSVESEPKSIQLYALLTGIPVNDIKKPLLKKICQRQQRQ